MAYVYCRSGRERDAESFDKSTTFVSSLHGPAGISSNLIHALTVRQPICYTLAKIVILQTISIVYVPRPVSRYQIALSDFSDLCESPDIVLEEMGGGTCFRLPR